MANMFVLSMEYWQKCMKCGRGVMMTTETFYNYPKEVSDIFYEAVEMLNGEDWQLLYGPSHIVWEDGNMMDEHIDYCLSYGNGNVNDEELKVVHWSLNKLKELPLSLRKKVSDGNG